MGFNDRLGSIVAKLSVGILFVFRGVVALEKKDGDQKAELFEVFPASG